MKKILIVEDDYPVREMYKAVLVNEGYAVETTKNGREALFRIPEFRPDCLLLDINMPELSGPELVRRLKSSPDPGLRAIPFIITTGEPHIPPERRASLEADPACRGFLPKNVDVEMLVRAVRSVLGPGV